MINKKKFEIGMFFIFVILFISLVSSSYIQTNPQFTQFQTPGLFSDVSSLQVDPSVCEAGQDFIVQIPPFGCTPAVVRSDLLEEQNVPVYCQLSATKLNPLINVKAIDGIKVLGDLPSQVSGVGFLPARAALGVNSGGLESSIMENIGYVVILLKQQPNESALENCEDSDVEGEVCYVEGDLKTNIQYDVKNAFGIGRVTHILPEMTDSEWEEKKTQYSFWNAKGYLRAEDVGDDSAKISIYDGVREIKSVDLQKGKTSDKIYLPGYTCFSSLELKLDDLESPDTRVKLKINNDYIEVKEDEKFLGDRCYVSSMSDAGIFKSATINCKEDKDGRFLSKAYELSIAPKVRLSVNGNEKDYGVGDLLYSYTEGETGSGRKNYVYLGYVASESGKDKDLEIGIIKIPEERDGGKLTDAEINYIGRLFKTYSLDYKANVGKETLGNAFKNFVGGAWELVGGLASNIYTWLVEGKSVTFISFDGSVNVLGENDASEKAVYGNRNLVIVGFAEPVNIEFNISSVDETKAKQYYDLAEKDYETLIDSFSSEKYLANENTFGEEALYAKIELNRDLGQKKTAFELCEQFKESYPDSKTDIGICNDFEISNQEISSTLVFVNGKTSRITLVDIEEPGLDEFSAEIDVRGPNGKMEHVILRRNQPYYLEGFRYRKDESIAVSIDGISKTSYKYNDKLGWQWSNGSTYISVNQQHSHVDYRALNERLKEKEFTEGTRIINAAQNSLLETEVIELLDLEAGKAKVRVSVWGKDTLKRTKDLLVSGSNTLELDKPQSFGSDYSFVLSKVNVKKEAKVTIIPNIQDAGSQTNFSFKIGIEKRGIQLSPGQTTAKLKKLNKTIEKWEDTGEKVGEAVETFKKLCLVGGAALVVKNFFANTGGKGLARKNVMNGEKGWKAVCADKVKAKEEGASTIGQCYNKYAPKIEKDVEDAAKKLEEQNAKIKGREKDITTKSANLLGEGKVNTTAYMENTIKEVSDYLIENNLNNFTDSSGKQANASDFLKSDLWKDKSTFTKEQLRDIEYNAMILADKDSSETLKAAARARLDSTLGSAHTNSQKAVQILQLSENAKAEGLSGIGVSVSNDKTTNKEAYNGYKTTKQVGSIPSGVFLTQYVYKNEQYYIELGQVTGSTENYVISKVYDSSKNPIDDNEDIVKELKRTVSFVKPDASSYKHEIKLPEVKYYETPPYEGLPAIVPVDVKKGWYASVKQNIPTGSTIRSFDKSGRVNSFSLCNVGPDGIISGETVDKCMLINLGTGQPFNILSGVSEAEAKSLINRAVQAIEQASKQYGKGGEISILDQVMKVGSPAVAISGMECQDFMSPQDCKLLFNLCDPVICPKDRCDLGGTYPVKDPIQTGIIGGLVLCLPNLKEGVYVPVCLSAIKAGIDGLVSIQGSYRDCLQESLDTGRTVGICDEMHSVYLCEFFWKQALPLVEVGLPKLIAAIAGQGGARGGSQYIGVQNAWDTSSKAINYFTQTYAADAFKAFKARSTEQVGATVCKNFASGLVPNMDFINSFAEPDSPHQFHGRFDEIPFSTTTNPPTSHYKVFYHIYAGKDSSGYYKVYLKGSASSSFYKDAASSRLVAQGYMSKGETVSETKDFTAPSGYKEMCMEVNGQEECGFKEVSTSFGLDFVKDKAIEDQASRTNIQSEQECISGSASAYSLLNPNVQEGVGDLVNPEIYNRGIIRVCSTENPGTGTDTLVGTNRSRWREVGNCGNSNMKCWLDTSNIDEITKLKSTEESILSEVNADTQKLLVDEGKYETDFTNKFLEATDSSLKDEEKISKITELLDRVFLNGHKAELYLLRGQIYQEMAKELFEKEDRLKRETEAAELAKKVEAVEKLGEAIVETATEVVDYFSQLDDTEKAIVNSVKTAADCRKCGGTWYDTNICGETECIAISKKIEQETFGAQNCTFVRVLSADPCRPNILTRDAPVPNSPTDQAVA